MPRQRIEEDPEYVESEDQEEAPPHLGDVPDQAVESDPIQQPAKEKGTGCEADLLDPFQTGPSRCLINN